MRSVARCILIGLMLAACVAAICMYPYAIGSSRIGPPTWKVGSGWRQFWSAETGSTAEIGTFSTRFWPKGLRITKWGPNDELTPVREEWARRQPVRPIPDWMHEPPAWTTKSRFVKFMRAGWPGKWLTVRVPIFHGQQRSAAVFGPIGGGLKYTIFSTASTWRVDPLGLLASTFTFAVIALGVETVAFAAIRRRRASRGLCVACSYPLVRGAPVCPECGKAPRVVRDPGLLDGASATCSD